MLSKFNLSKESNDTINVNDNKLVTIATLGSLQVTCLNLQITAKSGLIGPSALSLESRSSLV